MSPIQIADYIKRLLKNRFKCCARSKRKKQPYFSDEWPGICQTGKKQSPIDIDTSTVIEQYLPPIRYVNYERDFVTFIENEGYTVSLKLDAKPYEIPSIRGCVIQKDYTLDNIHFHWPAEHTINEQKYPLEAHFVHFKTEAGNLTNSLTSPDGLVVLAVFYEITDTPGDVFDAISEEVARVAHQVHRPRRMDLALDPTELLPENLDAFYAYEGSLTTPDCNEVVKWIVYEQPASIGQRQLDKLTCIYTENGEKLVRNDRPSKPLNGRNVLYTTNNHVR